MAMAKEMEAGEKNKCFIYRRQQPALKNVIHSKAMEVSTGRLFWLILYVIIVVRIGALKNSKPHFVDRIGKFRQRTEHFVSDISSMKFSRMYSNPSNLFEGDTPDECFRKKPGFILEGIATHVTTAQMDFECMEACLNARMKLNFTCLSIQYYPDVKDDNCISTCWTSQCREKSICCKVETSPIPHDY
uniref:Uncharacterized protein n=1 Tax=Romanomermis culicivorax TaxID=13658 RepID=A0A915HK29_ROMCU